MEIVRTLKRIIAINKAIDKIPNVEKYDDIYNRLWDKKDALVAMLKEYKNSPDGEVRKIRRKNWKLACKYLNVNCYTALK